MDEVEGRSALNINSRQDRSGIDYRWVYSILIAGKDGGVGKEEERKRLNWSRGHGSGNGVWWAGVRESRKCELERKKCNGGNEGRTSNFLPGDR